MSVIEYEQPERFVVGTVGPPGQRTFFIQASDRGRRTQVSVEKMHVSLLAERIESLLDEVGGAEGGLVAAVGSADNAPLDTPISEDLRVEALGLTWDDDLRVVVVEAHDHDPEEVEDEVVAATPDLGTLRVTLTPAQARAFARRCETVVAAGRPSCPFCGGPLDPDGHICPRANGYRR